MSSVRSCIREGLADALKIRHDLHAHPELGYQEHRTSQKVCTHLKEWGVEFRPGLAGGTGVLARIPATIGNAPSIALRADMDALPINEETGVDYASTTPGLMHACGHDGHTTILLTVARVLSRQSERPNEVLLIFQPAEEGGAGGKKMCDDGVLSGRILGGPVAHIYGLHGHPTTGVGEVSTRVGPLLAAACRLDIEVRGRGGHAAAPHRAVDPVVAAAAIVGALQTVASRTVDPLDSVVVTIGKIEAGAAHNVIPEVAILTGTFRTLNDETEKLARATIERIVRSTAEAYGATASVTWEGIPYPVTRNDPLATERFRNVARHTIGTKKVKEEANPVMGGEDFSFYGQHVPACFFFLGLRPEKAETYPNLHAPTFNFNDEAIPTGTEIMCELALKPL